MAPVKNVVQVQCRNCGSGNKQGSPHCNRCGAPIDDGVSASVQQAQPASQFIPSTREVDPVVLFSADGQDRATVKQTYERAKVLLTQGESMEYIATSHGGLGRAPDCAVATNKRVMLFRKKVLGKVELDDCWWRDVGSASLVESKNGVNLKLDAIQGWQLIVENLPKAQADRIYSMAFTYADHLQGQSRPLGNSFVDHQSPSVPAPAHPNTSPTMLTPRLADHPPSLPNLGAAPLITTSNLHNSTGGLQSQPLQSPAQASPAFIPTPESVLQSILQNSALAELEEHGVPTRPMQWNAAAFQAPAVADVQPVVLTGNNPNQHGSHNQSNIDTEPHMRPLPPLTNLERIAVFTPASGPLTLESSPRLNTNSIPHASTPLRDSGALPSSPMLDAASLLGQWSDTADLPFMQDEPYPQITDMRYSSAQLDVNSIDFPDEKWSLEVSELPRVASPTGPITSGPLNTSPASGALLEVAPIEDLDMVEDIMPSWSEPEIEQEQFAPSVPTAPEPLQQAAPEVEVYAESAFEAEMPAIVFDDQMQSGPLYDPSTSSIRPTAPMGAEDYMLPMPGSMSSGPLLAAAGDMDDDLEDLYRNTSPMSTQRLDYTAHPEDADLATRINLTLHNTPPNQMTPSRGSGSLSRQGTDELKTPRASGSRTAGSGRTKADDPIAKMKQLKALLDAGLITEEDYSAKKSDILSRI